MRALTLLLAATLGGAVPAVAQTPAEEDFFSSLIRGIFGPGWSVQGHIGASRSGRFLLQDVPGGQRSLRDQWAFNFGVGAGASILPRVGFRIGYSYASSDLEFRDDDGDGSDALDVDGLGSLRRNTLSLEVIRFVLPSQLVATPYATLGVLGTWWVLDSDTVAIEGSGGDTQFRWGAVGSVGLQMRAASNFLVRLEYMTSSTRNPFTGRESFRAFGGVTIDEPTRVSMSDWRIAGVYTFGKPIVEDVVRPRTRPRR